MCAREAASGWSAQGPRAREQGDSALNRFPRKPRKPGPLRPAVRPTLSEGSPQLPDSPAASSLMSGSPRLPTLRGSRLPCRAPQASEGCAPGPGAWEKRGPMGVGGRAPCLQRRIGNSRLLIRGRAPLPKNPTPACWSQSGQNWSCPGARTRESSVFPGAVDHRGERVSICLKTRVPVLLQGAALAWGGDCRGETLAP